MITIAEVDRLKSEIRSHKAHGKTVGFTPTMGALHAGHASLINCSVEENDISICSIFVNPTQFNEKDDLEKYPRQLVKDQEILYKAKCDILFAPSVSEVYPNGDNSHLDIDLAGLDKMMEGKHRPGHFEGVVQVVKRLLDIVEPDRLYMGAKDFQQHTIIRYMIDYFNMDEKLVVCPTLRETNGLAMSSRNERLDPLDRKRAGVIYRVLHRVKEKINDLSIDELISTSMEYLDIPGFSPEYFSIVDAKSLKRIKHVSEAEEIYACTAVWAGDVRLIDNMKLKP